MAYFITERCVKCGACESECPNGAIVEEEKKFSIDYVKCVECGNCIDNCYNKAIDEI
jgi:ferredoxin